MAIATHPRCLYTLPRKRERFWTPNEKSSSSSVSKRFFWLSVRIEYASESVSFGASTWLMREFVRSPSTRSFAGLPTVRCKSEAPRWIISWRRARSESSCPGGAVAPAAWLMSRCAPSVDDRRFLDHFVQAGDAALHLLQRVFT